MWQQAQLLLGHLAHALGQRPQLTLAGPTANDKKVGNRTYLTDVQQQYVLSQLVLDNIYDLSGQLDRFQRSTSYGIIKGLLIPAL